MIIILNKYDNALEKKYKMKKKGNVKGCCGPS